MNRRELITGLFSLLAAPAVVRVSSLMPGHGERFFFWDYECPLLPDLYHFEPGNEALLKAFLSPSGNTYKGVWTFFGKDRNIYSDQQVAFRKEEYPRILATGQTL